MKFEKIKQAAIREFCTELTRGEENKGDERSFSLLMPFVRMLITERDELREFADQYEKRHSADFIAGMAKDGHVWMQMVLKAREAGCEVINNWDVRAVGRLIDLFPDCVAKKYRNAAITAYMADDEKCTWMVDFDTSQRRIHNA